jgi:hypothetical protein
MEKLGEPRQYRTKIELSTLNCRAAVPLKQDNRILSAALESRILDGRHYARMKQKRGADLGGGGGGCGSISELNTYVFLKI